LIWVTLLWLIWWYLNCLNSLDNLLIASASQANFSGDNFLKSYTAFDCALVIFCESLPRSDSLLS
jgi:hypothetical protein